MVKKCGTCVHFYVKPNEIEIAQHAPHISACQPGMPHCLGGQVRGGCAKWEEREAMGLPMPLGSGPAIDSTFVCPLWEAGGPSVKQVGSFNTGSSNRISSVSGPIGVLLGIAALGAVKNYVVGREDRKDQDALDRTYDEFYYE